MNHAIKIKMSYPKCTLLDHYAFYITQIIQQTKEETKIIYIDFTQFETSSSSISQVWLTFSLGARENRLQPKTF